MRFQLLYLDESDLHLHPNLRKMWMFKGKQATIPAAGTNAKLHVFGALNFASHQVTYQVFPKKRQWQMESFLLHLFESYPEELLVLVLDNVSYHQTALIESLLAAYSARVFVVWLPEYAPELNLIERFWEHMKQVVFDSYYFGNADSMEQATHEFFEEHNHNPEADFAFALRSSKD